MPRKGDGKIGTRLYHTDEKYNIEGLLSALLEKAKKKEEPDLVPLRAEIKKGLESGNEIIRKFLGLMESFEDIIPDEKQRYNATIRALSATSGLSQQDVLESANDQLGELKELKKRVLSALPDFRDALKVMESRSQEITREIAKLREKILEFEKEEQELLGSMEARESELKIVEETVSKLFTDIGAEISGIRERIVEFTTEKASPEPAATPDSVEHRKDKEKKGGGTEVKGKTGQSSETKETEWAKDCPMCGGRMNFHMSESMWMCYSCGHDESTKDKAAEAAAVAPASEPVPTIEPAAAAEPAVTDADEQPPGASAPTALPLAFSLPVNKPAPRKKACPACRKQMEWHEEEKSWLCSFCDYRRRIF